MPGGQQADNSSSTSGGSHSSDSRRVNEQLMASACSVFATSVSWHVARSVGSSLVNWLDVRIAGHRNSRQIDALWAISSRPSSCSRWRNAGKPANMFGGSPTFVQLAVAIRRDRIINSPADTARRSASGTPPCSWWPASCRGTSAAGRRREADPAQRRR